MSEQTPGQPNLEIPGIDFLTGLKNRGALMQELEHDALASPGNFALLFVDIDGLKAVNDHQGHEAGDKVLVETGFILENSLRTAENKTADKRPNDSLSRGVFRLAGDEFVIKLVGVKTDREVEAISNRLQGNLMEIGTSGGIQASIGGRVHIAGESGVQLLADVDRKMYDQKELRHKQQDTLSQSQEMHNYRQELLKASGPRFLVAVASHALEKLSGIERPVQTRRR